MPVLEIYRKFLRKRVSKRNMKVSLPEVFSEIYRKNYWGGTSGDYYSGSGSATSEITKPYLHKMANYLRKYDSRKTTIVDLGCGDFRVGSNFIDYCDKYIAVDVVPELVLKHQKSNYGKNVEFLCLDIVEEPLPKGKICFLRQVLQHLSNEQILKILKKLDIYETVFITEHYPTDNSDIEPNIDIVHGAGIRLYENSGVYLDKAPFNLSSSALELVLEVPGQEVQENKDKGVIRTFALHLKE